MSQPSDESEVVDVRGAARIVGLAVSTLDTLRSRGGGPEFLRVSKRAIRYKVDTLRPWRDSQSMSRTNAV
jgi:hypothetical protein